MKKIHNIISSELVVRTNNINLRQEFGEVGHSVQIRNENVTTIFTTEFSIKQVVFLTVNGVNLIEGVHFFVDSEFEIHISNNGDPLKDFIGQSVNILVSYMHTGRRFRLQTSAFPPVITTFYLNKTSGVDEKIIFDFSIEQRDGKNIYWSILKDGGETPLFSGSALATNNGHIVDSSGNLVELAYYVTNPEYLSRIGDDITFTLVVIYDLTEDGTKLDEKLLKDAKYRLIDIAPTVGNITTLPAFIDAAGDHIISIDYTITNPSGNFYEWEVTRSFNGGPTSVISSGSSASNTSEHLTENIVASSGDNDSYRYYLRAKFGGNPDFVTLSNDRTTVIVPQPQQIGRAGYVDEAIFNYQDGSSTWRQIGYSGGPQDIVEYNNRIPQQIFTLDIQHSMLGSGVIVEAPVYTSGGARKVHFVLEVPETWGPIKFLSSVDAEIDIAAFNIINLGNGFVAYIYAAMSSSVSNPSKYKIDNA